MENEIWLDIKGYEGFYKVSNLGNIKSIDKITRHGHHRKERILKIVSGVYLSVDLCKDNIREKCMIHRLVATAFVSNTENKKCVNHIDANKLNNRVENLEWVTYKENSEHAVSLGLKRNQYGQNNNMVKLSDADVKKIKILIRDGVTPYRIHKSYFSHLGIITIYNISQNKTWTHITI